MSSLSGGPRFTCCRCNPYIPLATDDFLVSLLATGTKAQGNPALSPAGRGSGERLAEQPEAEPKLSRSDRAARRSRSKRSSTSAGRDETKRMQTGDCGRKAYQELRHCRSPTTSAGSSNLSKAKLSAYRRSWRAKSTGSSANRPKSIAGSHGGFCCEEKATSGDARARGRAEASFSLQQKRTATQCRQVALATFVTSALCPAYDTGVVTSLWHLGACQQISKHRFLHFNYLPGGPRRRGHREQQPFSFLESTWPLKTQVSGWAEEARRLLVDEVRDNQC